MTSAGAQIGSQLVAVESNPRLAAAMALTPGLPVSHLRAAALVLRSVRHEHGRRHRLPRPSHLPVVLHRYRNWLAYPQIDQLSTTRQVTAAYPPTYLTVGDADPSRTQATERPGRCGPAGCR